MNYCILNGVKSDSIKGLLISSLPPISKPLLRTEIEEIDGRDGDIITPLGYSAYDKEMEIGLYGAFDINEVISFFDSEGTVIFSNEPDKFYKYKIIKQIDFERLLRFRTATVTFHVQPFKYSAVETAFTFENDLLNIPDYTETRYGLTVTVSDGEIAVTGTSTRGTEFFIPISMTLPDGAYALEGTVNGTGATGNLVRVTQDAPINAQSVGNGVLSLIDDATATFAGGEQDSANYSYLWLGFKSGVTCNFTLDLKVKAVGLTVYNLGNTVSKPKLTLYGERTVNLSLNGKAILSVVIPADHITIDAEAMEAMVGTALANRYVAGDYADLALKAGKNMLNWSGDVSQVIVENYSRWI